MQRLFHPTDESVGFQSPDSVIGFDPQEGRYVAAQDAAQARQVIAYQESRVLDINRALDAQRECYRRTFGVEYRANEQLGLW